MRLELFKQQKAKDIFCPHCGTKAQLFLYKPACPNCHWNVRAAKTNVLKQFRNSMIPFNSFCRLAEPGNIWSRKIIISAARLAVASWFRWVLVRVRVLQTISHRPSQDRRALGAATCDLSANAPACAKLQPEFPIVTFPGVGFCGHHWLDCVLQLGEDIGRGADTKVRSGPYLPDFSPSWIVPLGNNGSSQASRICS